MLRSQKYEYCLSLGHFKNCSSSISKSYNRFRVAKSNRIVVDSGYIYFSEYDSKQIIKMNWTNPQMNSTIAVVQGNPGGVAID